MIDDTHRRSNRRGLDHGRSLAGLHGGAAHRLPGNELLGGLFNQKGQNI
jgi:hypothetical protein